MSGPFKSCRIHQLPWPRWLAMALLLIFFAQGAAAIPRLSLTADEPAFVGPGLAYLQTGDLRLETAAAHPPLMFALTAAPLLLQPAPDATALPGWAEADLSTFARAFVAALGDHLDAATFAMRLPVLLLALVGAALVFRWAADWFGPWAGLLALGLFTFDPNILAHATLATTDLGLAVFGFASAYLLHRFSRRPSRSIYFAAGVALGLTMGAKSSGVFALFVLIPLFLAARLFGPAARRPSLPRALAEAIVLVEIALAILWGLYGFEMRSSSGLGNLPLPFATQWDIWLGVRTHAQEGHTAFLMGEISGAGWRTYYPLAFALKTPLPSLILLAAALVGFLRAGPRRWRAECFLWVYPAAYALVTLLSTIAIGYRFLLVALPFLAVFSSRITPHASRLTPHASRITPHVPRLALCVLLAWLALGTVRLFPHYLAYFNELAGGPYEGYRYLVDSNLDWGQSFKALREYLEENDIEQVQLSYYTYADPALYGVSYSPIAPSPGAPPVLPSRFDPAPGVYVIGATTLQGVMVVEPDTFDWFRHREPIARPGVALFVYRVTPREAEPTWLAQCVTPVAPLTAEAAAEGFGRKDLRIAYFDCASAWLYPAGGESPGWYALFRETAHRDDVFLQAHLAQARLSYEQRRASALPPFVIYEQERPPTGPSLALDAPVEFGNLTFLGHAVLASGPARPGQTVEIETWWRMEGLPERPLSIMMHLAGSEGSPPIVGDGLGVPIEQWQAGDILVQRHTLALPADAPAGAYTPLTGVYWLDTMERWQAVSGDQAGLDALTLAPILVQP